MQECNSLVPRGVLPKKQWSTVEVYLGSGHEAMFCLRKHHDIILGPIRESVSSTTADDTEMIVRSYPSLDEGAKVSQRSFDIVNQNVIGRLQQGLHVPDTNDNAHL